jgi:hypothetical protein
MEQNRQRIELRVDRYTQVCLTVIAVLLTVMIAGLWAEGTAGPAGARAVAGGRAPVVGMLPNSGLQRKQMIEALEKQTAQIERLVQLFESGKAKVQIEQDGQDAAPQRAPKRKTK